MEENCIRRLASWTIEGLLTSAVVWLAALPLVAFRFHLVSPIGIVLNIPLIPLTSVALCLGRRDGAGHDLEPAGQPANLDRRRLFG